MPIVRGCVQRASPQHSPSQLADYCDQPTKSSKHVHSMNPGKRVKERTAWIRGNIPALRSQLKPRRILASYKEHPEEQSYIQPASRSLRTRSRTTHIACNLAARQFQSYATGKQNRCVQIKNVRQS